MNKKTVVFGLVGNRLDQGKKSTRWQTWRPTVAVCQHEELLIDRFELIHEPRDAELTERLVADIRSISPETDIRSHATNFDDAWDFEEVYGRLHEFARQYTFRPEQEDYLVHITTGTHVQQICWFLLAESRRIPAQLLQASPPKRNQATSGSYRTIDLDLSRYDALADRFALEHEEGLSFLKSGIATKNHAFNTLIEQIERVAIHSQAPMLLAGPTGAGKTQLARRIYELKQQRGQVTGRFVDVNCATLRGDQAMSALFGHERGSFTGATEARGGLLRAANDGILFLDEIGELGIDEQAMLLRAIEEKRFLPVGADEESESDFQLLAGTNRNLREAIAAGTFREDLFARINLWTFSLPGLRDRREDISPNVDYELAKFAAATGKVVRFNKEARQRFLRFAKSETAIWEANFRDLSAAMTRLATLAAGGRITAELVDEEIDRLTCQWTALDSDDSLLDAVLTTEQQAGLDRFDRVQLEEVLRVCRHSKSLSMAGRELFAMSRLAKKQPNDADRLRKYLARFSLTWADVSSE